MTIRDEQRNACIEATCDIMLDMDGEAMIEVAEGAFDALHGIVFACPIEATEEMIEAGQRYLDSVSLSGSSKLPAAFRWTEFFSSMAAAGDLTNAPEKTR